MEDKMLNVKVWHGGCFTQGDCEQYVGGRSEILKGIHTDSLTLFDFEDLAAEYGYKNGVRRYWKFPKTHLSFRHLLESDKDLVDMMLAFNDGETAEVYFEEKDTGGDDHQLVCVEDDAEPLQAVAEEPEKASERVDKTYTEVVNQQNDDPMLKYVIQESVEKESEVNPVKDVVEDFEFAAPSQRTRSKKKFRKESSATPDEESHDSAELTDFSDPEMELDRVDLFCDDEAEADASRVREHVQQALNEINVNTQDAHMFDDEDEEYVPSDDLLTASDNTDSDDVSEVRMRYPVFNEKTGFGKNIKISVGMQFRNKDVFRRALREHAIWGGFDFDYINNKRKRISAQCRAAECPWRIRASLVTDRNGPGYYQVTSLVPHENCGREFRNSRITARFLAERFLETFRDNPKWSVDAFCKHVKRELEVEVSYRKCYNAKKHAMELLDGARGEQYKLLRDYGAALKNWNSGTSYFLKIEDSRFERVYVCLSACSAGFISGCRPIISLDACHLKGEYKGQIHSAVGRDGNENMFPIAYAICE